LRAILGSERSELVRAFVREAALAKGVAASVASLIAGDCAEVWLAVSAGNAGKEYAHISVSVARGAVTAKTLLTGHSRFSKIVSTLGGRMRPDSGISVSEVGVDKWDVSVHRSLTDISETPFSPSVTSPAQSAPVPLSQDFSIDIPDKGDAAAIARCFLDVYGHHYVHSEVFAPHRYWSRVESGELIPVIARGTEGEVIGHVSLERESGALVAERGEAVVLPAYRGHHLLERMTERLSEEAPKRGLHGIYAEPLTIHTFSQRNDERAGMPVCAVLLGANPESFRPKDIACPTAGQRQSYLRTFRFVRQPAARTVQAPEPYREILVKIYESLGITPTLATPSEILAPESRTAIKVNDRAYGMIRFDRIGRNVAIELEQAFRDVQALGARSVQLSAPVGDPGLPRLTDAARGLGFFFCGLGPAFSDGEDIFLLQFLTEPLDTAKLQLFSDRAKELVAFIDRDRSETSTGAASRA
jgi:hypothetical protein